MALEKCGVEILKDKEIARSEILGRTGKQVSYEKAVNNGCLFVDVRSSAEFISGTIPGAVNIPLFDEHERSVIGTVYHHGGHEQAVQQGFDYVGEKLAELLDAFLPYRTDRLAVFCARGGMRSLSIVNLLNQRGYDAFQLEGGYKKYRHATLEILNTFEPRLIVIHGLTGTGKTRILQQLDNSIDLEELARHRSSLFGGLDRDPSNQRNFESLLAQEISNLGAPPYFIEGESRKIGRVFIPRPLAAAMKKAVLVNVHCSLETRIERIIEDYPVVGDSRRAEIRTILESLQHKMGTRRVEEMCRLLQEGNLHELVRILLVEYYDKRYARSMKNYRFDQEVSSENITEAAAVLTRYRTRQIQGC